MAEVVKGDVRSVGKVTSEKVDKETVYTITLQGNVKFDDSLAKVTLKVASTDEGIEDLLPMSDVFHIAITRLQKRLDEP